MSPERDKTHRHGLTRQAACKGQPWARQRSRQPGRKAGEHVHLGDQALPGWHSLTLGTWPSDSRSQTQPEGHLKISRCLGHSLLPMAGWCMHTLTATIPWHKVEYMQVASAWEPPVTSPSPDSLCQNTPQHQQTCCCTCPASSPVLAPLHPCPHPAAAGAQTTWAQAPTAQIPLPLILHSARGQSCSSSWVF